MRFCSTKKEKTHDRSQKKGNLGSKHQQNRHARHLEEGPWEKAAFHPSQYTFQHFPTVDSFDKTTGASQRVVVFVVTKPDYD